MSADGSKPSAPPLPEVRLSVGVTGHRANNAAFAQNAAAIEAAVNAVFAVIDAAIAAAPAPFAGASFACTRLNTMLADGADQLAVDCAAKRNWEIVAPLPFGLALTAAIGADAHTAGEVDAALAYAAARAQNGAAEAVGATDAARAAIDQFMRRAHQAKRFELAERDARIADLLRQRATGEAEAAASFVAETSHRYALASRIIIEQSDVMVAVWDGASRTQFGGTGHTIATALDAGVAVVLVPAQAPDAWRVLRAPEALAGYSVAPAGPDQARALTDIVAAVMAPGKVEGDHRLAAFRREEWRPRSNVVWHGYRRIEALFGESKGKSPFRAIGERYELPEQVAAGSWARLFAAAGALPGVSAELTASLDASIARRFAWADGLATHLSDAYRGGMVLNFLLSALAIIGGLAYLPFGSLVEKAVFACFELTTLCLILFVTAAGRKRRWHARWFESRRVAEYLRHGPILLLLGVARPLGRWPRGVETSWPEWYARHSLRQVGLPALRLTQTYLQAALTTVLRTHVVNQRDYHIEKARRLSTVHENLDRLSSALFVLAFMVVAANVALRALGAIPGGPDTHDIVSSNYFTFFGVILPMMGATIAGIRYFGDFERFAGISDVVAEKLDHAAARIDQLLAGGAEDIDYKSVSRIVHAVDDHVVAEIESWQSVFGGKDITIPV